MLTLDEIKALSDDVLIDNLCLFVLEMDATPNINSGLDDYHYPDSSIKFNPCQDRNHTQLVLERIAELGLKDDFIRILRVIAFTSYDNIWGILTVTPRHLCEAALFVAQQHGG